MDHIFFRPKPVFISLASGFVGKITLMPCIHNSNYPVSAITDTGVGKLPSSRHAAQFKFVLS
jgi:hypothetical protein